MIWQKVNFTNPGHVWLMKEVKDGDTLLECNQSQYEDTEVFKGIKDLKVVGGNSVNCIFPFGTKVSRTNDAKNEYEDSIREDESIKKVVKNNLGKMGNDVMSDKDRKQILASEEITNTYVLRQYKKEIAAAKLQVLRG